MLILFILFERLKKPSLLKKLNNPGFCVILQSYKHPQDLARGFILVRLLSTLRGRCAARLNLMACHFLRSLNNPSIFSNVLCVHPIFRITNVMLVEKSPWIHENESVLQSQIPDLSPMPDDSDFIQCSLYSENNTM
jgi:hypothetical protein